MQTSPCECLSVDFNRPMRNIDQAWEAFVPQFREAGYLFGNQGGETYKDWRDFEADDIVTERQMGVVACRHP